MRTRVVFGIAALGLSLGCATSSGEGTGVSDARATTDDGLVQREIDMPGVLYLKDGHGIGSYDAFLIPPAAISYARRSRRLEPELEEAFLASLEQSLIDAARAADIPIVRKPGRCVMWIGVALFDVDIERSRSDGTLGHMTLGMEFRDSTSNQALLRYAVAHPIESTSDASTRQDAIQRSFDEMVAGMELSGALRAAGLADDEIRPGCNGTLAQRGRATAAAVSARGAPAD